MKTRFSLLHKLIISVMIIITLVISAVAYAENKDYRFLSIADIHFDPFLACHNRVPCPLIEKLQRADVRDWPAILQAEDKEAPQYYKDTNYALLSIALQKASLAAKEQKVQFVLVLGDLLGHKYREYFKKYTHDKSYAGYSAFVKKVLLFLSNQFSQAFAPLDVYSVVGNNDSYRGDYYTKPQGEFFNNTASLWSSLINTNTNRIGMRDSFSKAGYYAIDLPTKPSLRLIALNTVLFSYKARGAGVNLAADEELKWLHNELAAAVAKHQPVLIAMHIPEGVDVYALLKYRLFQLIGFWKPALATRFNEELKQFSPIIVGVLSGHLHSDWAQTVTMDEKNYIPMSGTPSISPIFGNNPSFKIYTYTPGKPVEQAETYRYLMNRAQQWTTYLQSNS